MNELKLWQLFHQLLQAYLHIDNENQNNTHQQQIIEQLAGLFSAAIEQDKLKSPRSTTSITNQVRALCPSGLSDNSNGNSNYWFDEGEQDDNQANLTTQCMSNPTNNNQTLPAIDFSSRQQDQQVLMPSIAESCVGETSITMCSPLSLVMATQLLKYNDDNLQLIILNSIIDYPFLEQLLDHIAKVFWTIDEQNRFLVLFLEQLGKLLQSQDNHLLTVWQKLQAFPPHPLVMSFLQDQVFDRLLVSGHHGRHSLYDEIVRDYNTLTCFPLLNRIVQQWDKLSFKASTQLLSKNEYLVCFEAWVCHTDNAAAPDPILEFLALCYLLSTYPSHHDVTRRAFIYIKPFIQLRQVPFKRLLRQIATNRMVKSKVQAAVYKLSELLIEDLAGEVNFQVSTLPEHDGETSTSLSENNSSWCGLKYLVDDISISQLKICPASEYCLNYYQMSLAKLTSASTRMLLVNEIHSSESSSVFTFNYKTALVYWRLFISLSCSHTITKTVRDQLVVEWLETVAFWSTNRAEPAHDALQWLLHPHMLNSFSRALFLNETDLIMDYLYRFSLAAMAPDPMDDNVGTKSCTYQPTLLLALISLETLIKQSPHSYKVLMLPQITEWLIGLWPLFDDLTACYALRIITESKLMNDVESLPTITLYQEPILQYLHEYGTPWCMTLPTKEIRLSELTALTERPEVSTSFMTKLVRISEYDHTKKDSFLNKYHLPASLTPGKRNSEKWLVIQLANKSIAWTKELFAEGDIDNKKNTRLQMMRQWCLVGEIFRWIVNYIKLNHGRVSLLMQLSFASNESKENNPTQPYSIDYDSEEASDLDKLFAKDKSFLWLWPISAAELESGKVALSELLRLNDAQIVELILERLFLSEYLINHLNLTTSHNSQETFSQKSIEVEMFYQLARIHCQRAIVSYFLNQLRASKEGTAQKDDTLQQLFEINQVVFQFINWEAWFCGLNVVLYHHFDSFPFPSRESLPCSSIELIPYLLRFNAGMGMVFCFLNLLLEAIRQERKSYKVPNQSLLPNFEGEDCWYSWLWSRYHSLTEGYQSEMKDSRINLQQHQLQPLHNVLNALIALLPILLDILDSHNDKGIKVFEDSARIEGEFLQSSVGYDLQCVGQAFKVDWKVARGDPIDLQSIRMLTLMILHLFCELLDYEYSCYDRSCLLTAIQSGQSKLNKSQRIHYSTSLTILDLQNNHRIDTDRSNSTINTCNSSHQLPYSCRKLLEEFFIQQIRRSIDATVTISILNILQRLSLHNKMAISNADKKDTSNDNVKDASTINCILQDALRHLTGSMIPEASDWGQYHCSLKHITEATSEKISIASNPWLDILRRLCLVDQLPSMLLNSFTPTEDRQYSSATALFRKSFCVKTSSFISSISQLPAYTCHHVNQSTSSGTTANNVWKCIRQYVWLFWWLKEVPSNRIYGLSALLLDILSQHICISTDFANDVSTHLVAIIHQRQHLKEISGNNIDSGLKKLPKNIHNQRPDHLKKSKSRRLATTNSPTDTIGSSTSQPSSSSSSIVSLCPTTSTSSYTSLSNMHLTRVCRWRLFTIVCEQNIEDYLIMICSMMPLCLFTTPMQCKDSQGRIEQIIKSTQLNALRGYEDVVTVMIVIMWWVNYCYSMIKDEELYEELWLKHFSSNVRQSLLAMIRAVVEGLDEKIMECINWESTRHDCKADTITTFSHDDENEDEGCLSSFLHHSLAMILSMKAFLEALLSREQSSRMTAYMCKRVRLLEKKVVKSADMIEHHAANSGVELDEGVSVRIAEKYSMVLFPKDLLLCITAFYLPDDNRFN